MTCRTRAKQTKTIQMEMEMEMEIEIQMETQKRQEAVETLGWDAQVEYLGRSGGEGTEVNSIEGGTGSIGSGQGRVGERGEEESSSPGHHNRHAQPLSTAPFSDRCGYFQTRAARSVRAAARRSLADSSQGCVNSPQ